jgi:hypothetical protein
MAHRYIAIAESMSINLLVRLISAYWIRQVLAMQYRGTVVKYSNIASRGSIIILEIG